MLQERGENDEAMEGHRAGETQPWIVYDAPLEDDEVSFDEYFRHVLPKDTGLRNYVESELKALAGEAIGLELVARDQICFAVLPLIFLAKQLAQPSQTYVVKK